MFDWDESKIERCLELRGFSFFDIIPVFDDPHRIIEIDDRENYGEIRYRMIGKLAAMVFVIIYTVGQEVKRVISARPANRKERQRYGQSQT